MPDPTLVIALTLFVWIFLRIRYRYLRVRAYASLRAMLNIRSETAKVEDVISELKRLHEYHLFVFSRYFDKLNEWLPIFRPGDANELESLANSYRKVANDVELTQGSRNRLMWFAALLDTYRKALG